ncbi:predicted protein [Naegleria gruberi]|uniref:GCS light chain n=1 Tax=Naegleria gruberi TaxID=5762 RepID=D2VND7_NAEGR|nr:uncharacterized protein NAEGRDRAFT_70459 [Naegleria gruberi]EFC41639.1 predicted protein [Naegleria gruberi]|eukprot:XP_002674383.1 predicted protein [Naegleria gruberi strain NEG-M]
MSSVTSNTSTSTSTNATNSRESSRIIKAKNLSQHEALLETEEHYETFLDASKDSKLHSDKVWIKPDPSIFKSENVKNLVEQFQQQHQSSDDEYSLTLQLFPDTTTCPNSHDDLVLSAVIHTLQELKRSHVDLLLIKVSNSKHLLKYWADMELLVENNLVKQIGICDIEVNDLEHLVSQVKIMPNVVQVNLASYESIESISELSQYCTGHSIKVLTGSRGSFSDFANAGAKAAGSKDIQLNWVVRYSLLSRPTSVVSDMGFLVKLDGTEKCTCISNQDQNSL